MAEILRFEEHTKKRLVDKIVTDFGNLYSKSAEVTEEFAQLMSKDPLLAINKLPEFIEKARNINPEKGFVEAVAGGPNQDWIAPLIDIVGVVYPTFDQKVRKAVLLRCLDYLDKLNYFTAQLHVEKLNEPWMIGDIIINRPLYYSGYKEYAMLLEKSQAWKDFYPHLEETRSAFWLSFAVIHNKYASKEIKANFYQTFPSLVDRTLDAIAGYNFAFAKDIEERNGTPIKETLEGELFKYDSQFHSKLLKKIHEKKWIDLKV